MLDDSARLKASSNRAGGSSSFSIDSLASALEALLAESAASSSEPDSLWAGSETTASSESDSEPGFELDSERDQTDFSFGLEPDSDPEGATDEEAASARAFESLFENFESSEPVSDSPELLLEPEISSLTPEALQIPDEFLFSDANAVEAPETPTETPAPPTDSSFESSFESLTAEIDFSLLDQFAAPADSGLSSQAQTSESLSLDNFDLGTSSDLETSTPERLATPEPDLSAAASADLPVSSTAENWFGELDSSPQPAPDVQPDNGLESLLIAFGAEPGEPDRGMEVEPPTEATPPTPEQPEPFTAAELFQFGTPAKAGEPVRPESAELEPVESEPVESEPVDAAQIAEAEGFDLFADSPEPLVSGQLNDLLIPDELSDQFSNQFDDLTNLEIDLEALEVSSEGATRLNRTASPDLDRAESELSPDLAPNLGSDLNSDLGSDLGLDLGADLTRSLDLDLDLNLSSEPTMADTDWLAEQLDIEAPQPSSESTLEPALDFSESSELPEFPNLAAEEMSAALLPEDPLPEWESPPAAAELLPADQALEFQALEFSVGSDTVDSALTDSALTDSALAAPASENLLETEPFPSGEGAISSTSSTSELTAESEPTSEIDLAPDSASHPAPGLASIVASAAPTFPETGLVPPTELPAESDTSPAADLAPDSTPDSALSSTLGSTVEPIGKALDQPEIEAPTPSEIALPAAPIEASIRFEEKTGFEEESGATAETGLDDSTLAQLDQLLAPPEAAVTAGRNTTHWCLGIDIGTTGLSAVLLNQAESQLYPIYWQAAQSIGAGEPTAKKQFRLSTSVALSIREATEPTASPLPTLQLAQTAPASADHLSDWKPFLKLALPHHSPQTSQWEPVLQWTTQQTLPLRTLQEVLQELLLTLNPARRSALPVTCGALGLEAEQFAAILQNLNAVVLGCPSNWLDAYSFNLREAVLQAELVSQPGQVVFVEEAIAALLSALPATNGRPVLLSSGQGQSGHIQNANWQGMTLILTAGTSVTELVLVNLPPQLQQLNATDFYVRSLPYAGQGLDQDIISQILYPALIRAAQVIELEADIATDVPSLEPKPESKPEPKPEPGPDFSLPLIETDTLNSLIGSSLPAAAELALVKRHQFQQRLLSSELGQRLLATAHALKITLQYQSQFRLQYGDSLLVLERQDLTSQVFLPYLQRLNRELNTLLAQTNTTATAIQQVICTGGTASASVMTRWLRQKLPNATIIQDTYARPASPSERQISSCSRIAYGLATLPLHTQVIDWSRHRYSDYYLLAELLRTLPQQPLRVGAIMELLEQRGIDTQTCRFRILALLDGHLPVGLVPAEADAALLTPTSAANPDYQAIRLAPLLRKPADRTYEPNRAQWAYLQYYLETLLADTEQTLSEPLGQGLSVEVE